jgi:hypothetical protein
MPTAAPLNTWDGNVGFCLRAAYMGEDTCFVRGLRIRAASLVFFASFSDTLYAAFERSRREPMFLISLVCFFLHLASEREFGTSGHLFFFTSSFCFWIFYFCRA